MHDYGEIDLPSDECGACIALNRKIEKVPTAVAALVAELREKSATAMERGSFCVQGGDIDGALIAGAHEGAFTVAANMVEASLSLAGLRRCDVALAACIENADGTCLKHVTFKVGDPDDWGEQDWRMGRYSA